MEYVDQVVVRRRWEGFWRRKDGRFRSFGSVRGSREVLGFRWVKGTRRVAHHSPTLLRCMSLQAKDPFCQSLDCRQSRNLFP